ncbi:MAG: hypothetical protein SFW35_10260 [Chitinophagales bacterium]|nr:hypothetical protein [Chitinophagales bacterium]
MGKKLKVVLLGVLVIVAIALGVGLYLYNKPHTNVVDARPERIFTATELYAVCTDADSSKRGEWQGKIIQVEGQLAKLDKTDSSANIFLSIEGHGGDNISCAVDRNYLKDLAKINDHDLIKVKGICSGLNKFEDADLGISTTDILLTRCVLVK